MDTGLRLLLDPYLCFGPGSEDFGRLLFRVSQRCAALGLQLCVEEPSWREAASDPDVQRRGVDLGRLEPLVRLPALPLPSERDLAARFAPVRNEIDRADLALLGALHARIAHLLVAEDGRLHRLAARGGLRGRVLSPADALAWLDALAGEGAAVSVGEDDPRVMLAEPAVARMLAEDCEPFDPYLRGRMEARQGRLFVARERGEPVAAGLLAQERDTPTLVALACGGTARGNRALEPVIGAALAVARQRRAALAARVPPHQDHALLLLDALGFERRGRDEHGRELLLHGAPAAVAAPAPHGDAWLLPLDAGSHARLLPELAGERQAGLFEPGTPRTLAGPLRRQLLRSAAEPEPAAGDLLLFCEPGDGTRPWPATIMAVARVERVARADGIPELLAMTAGGDDGPLAAYWQAAAQGPVSVFDLRLLGRLLRPLPAAAVTGDDAARGARLRMQRLEAAAWRRLGRELELA